MSRHVLLLFGLLVGLLGHSELLPGAGAAEEIVVVRSAHYELHHAGAQSEAEEYAAVLEAAWPQYEAFFGAAPKLSKDERLRVHFARDRAGFERAIRADGTRPPSGAGGYYWPGSRAAYLYKQPTRYYTRALLIHECAHQFHYLARTGNRNPKASWYTEGVAEHLCWHEWDGEQLTLGLRPVISLKDYPKAAAKEIDAQDFDLLAAVSSPHGTSRPVGWALLHFMATQDKHVSPARFRRFRSAMDKGAEPARAFERHIGDAKKLLPVVRAWLQARAQPWDHVFNEWEAQATGQFRGTASVVSLCAHRQPAQAIEAQLRIPQEGRYKGGLVLHFTSSKDYTVALVNWRGGVEVNRRVDGRWRRLGWQRIPPPTPGGLLELRAVCVPGGVTLEIGGVPVVPFRKSKPHFAVPGARLGLCLERCTLVFEQVRVQLPEGETR